MARKSKPCHLPLEQAVLKFETFAKFEGHFAQCSHCAKNWREFAFGALRLLIEHIRSSVRSSRRRRRR